MTCQRCVTVRDRARAQAQATYGGKAEAYAAGCQTASRQRLAHGGPSVLSRVIGTIVCQWVPVPARVWSSALQATAGDSTQWQSWTLGTHWQACSSLLLSPRGWK